jgi:hypothetical protein
MPDTAHDILYRRALEAEDGQSVSAGARVTQVLESLASGRGYFADLSAIPEDKRRAMIGELNDLVRRALNAPAA